jgi:hypothetical protein
MYANITNESNRSFTNKQFGVFQERVPTSTSGTADSTVKSETRRQSLMAAKDQSTAAMPQKSQSPLKQSVIATAKEDVPRKKGHGQAVVAFDYVAAQDDELTLRKGETIILLNEEEDG